jgi:hypothetical protein
MTGPVGIRVENTSHNYDDAGDGDDDLSSSTGKHKSSYAASWSTDCEMQSKYDLSIFSSLVMATLYCPSVFLLLMCLIDCFNRFIVQNVDCSGILIMLLVIWFR